MQKRKQITTPLTREQARGLCAGETVSITGTIYTARDAAHQRLVTEFTETGRLPFDLTDQIIYYAGPAPAKPGQPIGSVGPTTSYRMDAYAPTLIALGQTGMIGKGSRNSEVIAAMQAHGAVYFGATGGAGALLAQRVTHAEVIAYPDLGAEAIRRLTVVDFPAVVIIDAHGNNLYETEPEKYRISER